MLLTRQNSNFVVIIYCIALLNAVLGNFFYCLGYLDEIIAVVVFIYSIVFSRILYKKEFFCFIILLIFYVVYSYINHLNVPAAIIRDAISIAKPFLCFYSLFYLKYNLTLRQRQFISRLSLILSAFLWTILPFISVLYTNTTFFYPPCVVCAITYLIFSEKKKRDLIIASIILIPGLFTVRAKFYTEFILFIYLTFFVQNRIRFSFKQLIALLSLSLIAILVNWEKFSTYFITGIESGVARSMLYLKSLSVFKDYFPFGSGFGTFGTDSAGKYYSPLYYDYDLNNIYGLSPIDYGTSLNFFSDTFYPVLIAQFGALGILAFIEFWRRRGCNISSSNNMSIKIFVFLIFFIVIECIASPTFTTMTIVPIMFLIAMLCSETTNLK